MNRIAVLFVVSIATTPITTAAFAEDLKTPQAMAAECGEVGKSGKVSRIIVRNCIARCSFVEKAKNSNEAEKWLKGCKDSYETVTSGFARKVELDRIAALTPTITEMADIEGVYLRNRRNSVQVLAEGRTDWQTHCNETAILILPDNSEFFLTARPNDRVRLEGVSFAPAGVKGRHEGCLAKSAIVLESVEP